MPKVVLSCALLMWSAHCWILGDVHDTLKAFIIEGFNLSGGTFLLAHCLIEHSLTEQHAAKYTTLLVFLDRSPSWNTGLHRVLKALEALATLYYTSFSNSPCISTTAPWYLISEATSLLMPIGCQSCSSYDGTQAAWSSEYSWSAPIVIYLIKYVGCSYNTLPGNTHQNCIVSKGLLVCPSTSLPLHWYITSTPKGWHLFLHSFAARLKKKEMEQLYSLVSLASTVTFALILIV